MSDGAISEADRPMARVIGRLLQVGVLLAAGVVATGAAVYLARHGLARPHYKVFAGEPEDLRHPTSIVTDAMAFRGRGIIQLGLLLLIATPMARVALSAAAFALRRDWLYTVITLLVLGLLIVSLVGGV